MCVSCTTHLSVTIPESMLGANDLSILSDLLLPLDPRSSGGSGDARRYHTSNDEDTAYNQPQQQQHTPTPAVIAHPGAIGAPMSNKQTTSSGTVTCLVKKT